MKDIQDKNYLGHKYNLAQYKRSMLILVRDKLGEIRSTSVT